MRVARHDYQVLNCATSVPHALEPFSAGADETREGVVQRRCTLSSSAAVMLMRFAGTEEGAPAPVPYSAVVKNMGPEFISTLIWSI